MGTKWGPNGTKWGPKAEMLIFHWFYKVFGGSDWGPKAKMLIFHWFYKLLGAPRDLKTPRVAPKTPPRRTQDDPKTPQDGPRRPQDTPKTPPKPKCSKSIGFKGTFLVPKIVAPGPKSKNVDFSLVLQAFLRHRVGTKSQNVDFSFVFKGKTAAKTARASREHRAGIAGGPGRHSWRGPPVNL